MKLDKVRQIWMQRLTGSVSVARVESVANGNRTIRARSLETNSLLFPKYHPILSRLGISPSRFSFLLFRLLNHLPHGVSFAHLAQRIHGLTIGHISVSRMIAIFDEDGGGDVDFQEFVSGLSAFSSKGNKEEKLHFAFKVYDIDRDGYISNGELFIVLKMMVGSNLKDQQLQQVRKISNLPSGQSSKHRTLRFKALESQ